MFTFRSPVWGAKRKHFVNKKISTSENVFVEMHTNPDDRIPSFIFKLSTNFQMNEWPVVIPTFCLQANKKEKLNLQGKHSINWGLKKELSRRMFSKRPF